MAISGALADCLVIDCLIARNLVSLVGLGFCYLSLSHALAAAHLYYTALFCILDRSYLQAYNHPISFLTCVALGHVHRTMTLARAHGTYLNIHLTADHGERDVLYKSPPREDS
jgi:hypothetical protein